MIVAGGELGRLFADLGAEVIKVESAAYPDGLRQTRPGQPMSRSWALTHRNEYSLGLDLRHPEGADVFRRLVAESDAVFANFKPGTLASLGFSYDALKALNPRIVLAESSAFGAAGPWSMRMGYGPLVRATTGVSRLWRSDDPADAGFYDATTIYPDHVAARITAIAALAALIRRDSISAGARVHISQAEVAVNQLCTVFVAEAARAEGLTVVGGDAIHGVHPCAGDDEWCVVSVRSDTDRAALAAVLGEAELPRDRSRFQRRRVGVDGTAGQGRRRRALAGRRSAGGPMNRAVDVLADPQLGYRRVFAEHGPSAVRRTDARRDRARRRRATSPRPSCGPLRCPVNTPGEICRDRLGMDAARDRPPDRRRRACSLDRPIRGDQEFIMPDRPADTGADRLRPVQSARRATPRPNRST